MVEGIDSLGTAITSIITEGIKEAVREAMKEAPYEDRLLDAGEASVLLSVSEDWLYRNAKKLPFTRKLGRKMLRFSYQGILKYIQSRQ